MRRLVLLANRPVAELGYDVTAALEEPGGY